MTGIWFIKMNGEFVPYSETQDAYEGVDALTKIWELMLRCDCEDTIEVLCELPE